MRGAASEEFLNEDREEEREQTAAAWILNLKPVWRWYYNLVVLLQSVTLLLCIPASLSVCKPTARQPEFHFSTLQFCSFLPPPKASLKVSSHFDGT